MITHHPATPAAMLGGPLLYRELLWALVKRDFVGRYKGSVLGATWSLFTPGVPIHAGALLIPLILLPLILMIMGLSWLLASLGVYLRDLAQATSMATAVALLMAPVFYPLEALPEGYRALLVWNPITLPVIQLLDLMLWGTPLRWEAWAISLLAGALVCQGGYWWFQRSRRGFADVL